MAEKLILLTGGTGHVGYATVIEALRAGYKVRAVIRRESSIAEMKATKSVQPYLANLAFINVNDMTVDGAFDKAVKGVDYIVHIASPLPQPSEDYEASIVQPAIRGTIGILKSALKEPSVRRVVITSSIGAVAPMEVWGPDYQGTLTPESTTANIPGPYDNFQMAYAASKIAAYNSTLDFVANEKPTFDVINIMPTFVVGKNELATTKEAVMSPAGSNALALVPLFGRQNPNGLASITVHVEDVAYVHIAALDPAIPGNQSFGANSHGVAGVQFDDQLDIVRKHFPKEVESGVFPMGGSQKSNLVRFNASRTEEVFGFKFKNFEEQIVSVAGWYAEVAAKADVATQEKSGVEVVSSHPYLAGSA